MVSDVTPVISSPWPLSAVSVMAPIQVPSTGSARMLPCLFRDEATVFFVSLALTFLKKELILLSMLVVGPERAGDKLLPDLCEVLESLVMGARLMPLGAVPCSLPPELPWPLAFWSCLVALRPPEHGPAALAMVLLPAALWWLSAELQSEGLVRALSSPQCSLLFLLPLRAWDTLCELSPCLLTLPFCGKLETRVPSWSLSALPLTVLLVGSAPTTVMPAPGERLVDVLEAYSELFSAPAKAVFPLLRDVVAVSPVAMLVLLPPGPSLAVAALAVLCS